MKANVQEILDSAGLSEPLYPGKKLVKKYAQPGDHKSHCVVFDWHDSRQLHIELKAGLTGKPLDASELRQYPVSFQAPTYVDIAFVETDSEETDKDEDEEGSKGKSGGGKKAPKKKLEDRDISLSSFSKAMDGKVPSAGEIKKFVVMGKELAKEAFGQALENLKEQMQQTKIMAMDLMKGVGDIIKRATPGGGLEAKGNETVKYKYDMEKNSPMFGGTSPG